MSNVFTSCLFSGPSLSISFFQIFSSNIRYVGPYLHLCPELCYVLEDQGGACGYILSTLDSLKFYRDFESVWLPLVTRKYPVMTKVNTEEEVNDNNSNNNWSYDLSFLPIPIPLPPLSLSLLLWAEVITRGSFSYFIPTEWVVPALSLTPSHWYHEKSTGNTFITHAVSQCTVCVLYQTAKKYMCYICVIYIS